MPRFHTPAFGPHAGKLCVDGEPVPELPEGFQPPLPVAVPDVVPSEAEERYRRGLEGAAVQIYAEHQKQGSGQSFEQVRARVIEGRRISQRKREG